MNATTTSRTFIGSVICIDLVGYSKRSVADQSAVKKRFNAILVQALQRVPAKNRVILDTGDGALISFLGDPDECFKVGLSLRDAMSAAAGELGGAPGSAPARIAIHLGSVKLSVGMSGNPAIVGDAVNVAERIVTFAQPGQIVVSRSFHDVISRLSEAHPQLFASGGTHTDKNGREHEIFRVGEEAREAAAGTTDPAIRQATVLSFKPRVVLARMFSALAGKARLIAGGSPPPTPIARAATYFPPAAANQGIRSGTVRARLDIDAAGTVTRVTILAADPPRVFDPEAIRSLQRWRFDTGAERRTYETVLDFKR